MISLNREKTVAYSIRGSGFVNAFDHWRWVGVAAIQKKIVDSSSVSEKARPWLGLAEIGCGKTEEGFGKKDSRLFTGTSRKMRGTSRVSRIFS
jgi:hypothetical protein